MSRVPKLRFKEFSKEWEIIELRDSLSFISYGFTNPMPEADRGHYLLTAREINNGKILYEIARKTTDEAYRNLLTDKSRPKINDILLTKDGTLGRVAIVDSEGICINQSLAVLRPNETSTSQYLFHLLSSPKYQTIMLNNAGGSTIKHIYITVVDKMKIGVPLKVEQQKIASFLSALDSKIEQLTRKKELLEQYKKGVMQKIFSQELRFKADDGSEFPEWEEKAFGECITHIGGTALEKYVSPDADYCFISIGNYSIEGKYIDNGQRIELNEKTKTKLLNKDDLVMVLNDKTSSGSLIGSTILIEQDKKYIYNQRSERIICKPFLSSLYLWHFLNSKVFRAKVVSLAQGGTQIYINFSSIKSIDINLPSIEEQTKIASFLSAIDTKIDFVAKQLDEAKNFKKGLLQQMFV